VSSSIAVTLKEVSCSPAANVAVVGASTSSLLAAASPEGVMPSNVRLTVSGSE
jgi:hypothetical protein